MEALIAMAQAIAPLLLAEGISSPDAERLLRSVCIHAAARADRARGRRPNVSRLALLTGVDRHVVARLLKVAPQPDAARLQTHRHRLDRVLEHWHADPAYSDSGRPRPLEIKAGPHRKSFWTLAKTCARDAYPPLILRELMKVGAVERLRDGRVRPRARIYKATDLDEEALRDIGARVSDLTRTMLSNLSREGGAPRVCETVETLDVDEGQLELVRRALGARSTAVLTEMQQLLNSPRWRRSGRSGRRVRIAWTCYQGEESLDSQEDSVRPRRKTHRAPARAAAKKGGPQNGAASLRPQPLKGPR